MKLYTRKNLNEAQKSDKEHGWAKLEKTETDFSWVTQVRLF